MDNRLLVNALGWIQEELRAISLSLGPPPRRKVAYRVTRAYNIGWDIGKTIPLPSKAHIKRYEVWKYKVEKGRLVSGLKRVIESGDGYLLGHFYSDSMLSENVLIERLDGSVVATTWDEIQFIT